MQNKIKLLSICTVLSAAISLTGCLDQGTRPNNPNISNTGNSQTQSSSLEFSGEQSSIDKEISSDVINSSESADDVQSVSINSDVIWGIGKTFDEITEKYGDVVSGNHNVYTFEKGYGRYVWDDDGGIDPTQSDRDENIEIIRGRDGCKIIGEISARNFLIGDLSTLNLDNLASKCGLEVVPLNPTNDSHSLYDGYKFAYYTHPSYENMTFCMCYKESGFDEEATFRISYDDKI